MTSNPSEEQLDLVSGRIIEIAQAICPYVALEAETYFDAALDEDMCAELFKRVIVYIENPEGVEPNVEDHPSARRLARYLLETVEYDILAAPLNPKLLKDMPLPSAGASSGLVMGYPRNVVVALAVAAVLLLCILAFFLLGGSAAPSPSVPEAAAGKHSRASLGKGFGGKRNGSRLPSL
ncbi:hypothetical protein AB1Y20_011352 [Prymnesium parvum]|uniref:Uncharacterized protein n=1 Tax=Prymnesium parvum TaxID=97485 RepID=A0AB34IML7_PRYPA|mmetsp:Transcript_32203/g.78220  ORF Transcript_32203/g.78220 Transcript_32203/m.78220 type:complete len:179 (+) Transcript_32203:28-564(+)